MTRAEARAPRCCTVSGDRGVSDRRHLAERVYATGSVLAARQRIYEHCGRLDAFQDWALGLVAVPAGGRVVDVGCGNGRYLRQLAATTTAELVGLDLSAALLSDLRPRLGARARLAVCDAAALPLPERTADVVLAMHMLYHVADMAQGARELRRIVKPDGTVLVATNADGHLAEIDALVSAAVRELAGGQFTRTQWARRLPLSAAADLLDRLFTQVSVHRYQGWLSIPSAAPVCSYLGSVRALNEGALPGHVSWHDVVTTVGHLLADVSVERPLRVRVDSGVVRARR